MRYIIYVTWLQTEIYTMSMLLFADTILVAHCNYFVIKTIYIFLP